MSEEEQLKLWREKGGQIEWRLAQAKLTVREMERDLAECDRYIKKLKERIEEKKKGGGREG